MKIGLSFDMAKEREKFKIFFFQFDCVMNYILLLFSMQWNICFASHLNQNEVLLVFCFSAVFQDFRHGSDFQA